MSKKINIGFIEDTHLRGGTQLRVIRAIKYFTQKGYEVFMISPSNSFVSKKAIEFKISLYTYNFDDIAKNKYKYENIRKEGLKNMDIVICTVHPPRNNFHCSLFAGEIIKKYNLNTILVPKTGTIVPSYFREFYLQDEIIKKNHIICINKFTKNYLIDVYGIQKRKISLIYQGVDINKFDLSLDDIKENKKKYSKNKNKITFLCMGVLEYRKGQLLLVDTFKILLKKYNNIELFLVGEGPDLEKIKINIGENNNIKFFDFTDNPEEIMSICDVLVLPSIEKEGLPNVVLEAMSSGKITIASKLGGISEVILNNKTGFIINPGDTVDLYNCIEKIILKYDELDIGKNAKKNIEKKFNEKKQFDKFLKLFQKLKKNFL